MARAKCLFCDSWALILDGKMACCGAIVETVLEGSKRMSESPTRRHGPPKATQDLILELQRFECFYCHRQFGQTVWKGRKEVTLRVEWDHVEPWIYGLDNSDQNFVASCQVCNKFKSSKMFRNCDEAEVYIAQAWERAGYSNHVPNLRRPVCAEAYTTAVLQADVPLEGMGPEEPKAEGAGPSI